MQIFMFAPLPYSFDERQRPDDVRPLAPGMDAGSSLGP
jgi:hypothetical protein